tara:strand:- start:787 stop:1479 length:693 start_codon:yes stop_codon:yes gene_type:complete
MGTHYSPPIVHENLLFCLDGKNTKSYSGSGTSTTNLASKINNGTINGPTFDSNGYWDFDGTNDYIDCENFHSTGALTSHASLTFEAWWNADSFSSGHGIVGYWPTSLAAGTRRGMLVWNGAGSGGFKVRFSSNGYNSFGNAAAPTGAWTHSMVTLASDGSNVIYQNGVKIGTPADVTLNTPANPAPLTIGRTESSEYWNGKIAIVRVYNKILTEREMSQNFNAQRRRFGV